MNILALDTTLGACSAAVALSGKGKPRFFSAYELREREHAEVIMAMIEKVMHEAGLAFDALDAIAVTVGPGSFTGVRVGVAAARGLALATGHPLIGVTSLEVMARQALDRLDKTPGTLAIALDARRGEVYLALFDGAGEMRIGPAALTPERAAARLPETDKIILAGSGAALVLQAAGESGRDIEAVLPDLQPEASTLARMALTRMALKRPPVEGPLRPLYLRPPDAKPQTGKALPRRD